MKEKRLNEIKGLLLIAASVIILASLVSFTPFDLKFYTSHPNIPPKNFIRTFGAYFAGLLLFFVRLGKLRDPPVYLIFGLKDF